MPDIPSTPSEPELTLETCEAAQVWFQPEANGMIRSLIVWRDRPSRLKLPAGRRVRTLVRGDVVRIDGEEWIVEKVEAWR